MSDNGNSRLALRGGVGVIFATGLMAILYGYSEGGDSVVMAIIVMLLTVGGLIALMRFVARHGDEIGEARFDTRNKDEKQE